MLTINRREFLKILFATLTTTELSKFLSVKEENQRWKEIELKKDNNPDFHGYDLEIAKDRNFVNTVDKRMVISNHIIIEVPETIKVYVRARTVDFTGIRGQWTIY